MIQPCASRSPRRAAASCSPPPQRHIPPPGWVREATQRRVEGEDNGKDRGSGGDRTGRPDGRRGAGPAGPVPGPGTGRGGADPGDRLREEYLPDLAAQLAARRGDPVKVEAVDNPADPDDALNANGGLLPSPHATLAGPTFTEWLDANA